MTKKTFNTAELFITGAADRAQQTAGGVDIHTPETETETHIHELTKRAIELEQQAKDIRKEALKAKREAIAAANAKYKGQSTTRFREKPDYENPRTRRAQLLFRQDVYDRAKEFCEANTISFNRLVELALLEYMAGGGK
jgi:hypothetical protein